jgi:hypothetical protein
MLILRTGRAARRFHGGEGGIRTHEPREGPPVFKTRAELDAERTLHDAEMSCAGADQSNADSFVVLVKALGGGWVRNRQQPSWFETVS